jgi:hypothetical protein
MGRDTTVHDMTVHDTTPRAPHDSVTDDSVHRATPSDTLTPLDETWGSESGARQHLGARVTSGKVYNRVEGMPILFGPTYMFESPSFQVHSSVFGIVRTVGPIRLASPDGGYDGHLDLRFGELRGRPLALGAGVRLYDLVTPVERWQMTEPEAGLAAFLLHRDYFDYYERHGVNAHVGWYGTPHLSVVAAYADERWTPREARDPFTLFRNSQAWRPNPAMDEGEFRLFSVDAAFDTRNDPSDPSGGWYITGTYEYGHSSNDLRAPRDVDPLANPVAPTPETVDYGRVFFDVRRYTRISPRSQINARLAFGGWVQGDALPMERTLSVGGPGTIPGYDFRKIAGDANVQTCGVAGATPAGDPAECDRVVLGQLEFRTQLASTPFGVSNARPVRLRAAGFTAKPVGVLFADVGRGWRTGTSWPSTYKADVGAGVDLGLLGVYVAKSVTDWSQAANVILRVRRRF